MKKTFGFLKTTVLGGLVVIVPLAVLIIVLLEILDFMLEVTGKLVELLPFEFLTNPAVVIGLALLTIVALCFLTGLLLLTSTGAAIKHRVDVFLEEKVPLYGMLQAITRQFVGIDDKQLTPAEIDLHGSGTRVLGFIVEQLEDGRYCVYVPDSPVLTVGRTYIVEEHQLVRLPGSTRAAVDAITQWGAGARQIYKAVNPNSLPSGHDRGAGES